MNNDPGYANHERNFPYSPSAIYESARHIALELGIRQPGDIFDEPEMVEHALVMPPEAKDQFPNLKALYFVPSYQLDGAPTDDLISIQLSDGLVLSIYDVIKNSTTGKFDTMVSHEAEESTPAVTPAEVDYDNEISYLNDPSLGLDGVDADKLDHLRFISSVDRTASPEELLLLGDILAVVSRTYLDT